VVSKKAAKQLTPEQLSKSINSQLRRHRSATRSVSRTSSLKLSPVEVLQNTLDAEASVVAANVSPWEPVQRLLDGEFAGAAAGLDYFRPSRSPSVSSRPATRSLPKKDFSLIRDTPLKDSTAAEARTSKSLPGPQSGRVPNSALARMLDRRFTASSPKGVSDQQGAAATMDASGGSAEPSATKTLTLHTEEGAALFRLLIARGRLNVATLQDRHGVRVVTAC
jgi:hypothetical protein